MSFSQRWHDIPRFGARDRTAGMDVGRRESPLELLGGVCAPLAVWGVAEVFILAPSVAWSNPRIWLVEAMGMGLVALLVWLSVLVIDRGLLRARKGRPSAGAVALWLVVLVVGCGEWWDLAGSRHLLSHKTTRLLALIVLLSIFYLVVRKLAMRFGSERRSLGFGFANILVSLVFYQVARQNLIWSGTHASAGPLLLFLVCCYATAALGILLWGGGRRVLWSGILLLAGVLGIRSTTTNVFDLHVVETSAPSAPPRPSVLLIVLDTFRADALDLSEGSGSRTPNLARFAAGADVYTHAISNASWTLPGHASIFTGQPLARHRTDFNTQPGFHVSLPPELPTAHQIFKANGYHTSCIAANGVIAPATGLLRGCQRFYHPGGTGSQRASPSDWASSSVRAVLRDAAPPYCSSSPVASIPTPRLLRSSMGRSPRYKGRPAGSISFSTSWMCTRRIPPRPALLSAPSSRTAATSF